MLSRLKILQQGLKIGKWSLNQVRAHQGLPPLPYGDRLYTTNPPKEILNATSTQIELYRGNNNVTGN